jgi:ubiquinone/menaquinone biosynthesis C-methylase UbiE
MSKHSLLTEDEFEEFTPNRRTLHYIELYCQKNRLNKQDVNVLDWGCGRGREVLWLRENGYNAYGIDIDSQPISNGIELFKAKGYDDSILRVLSSNGETGFPDNYFNFIFSNQVFEHVRDIDTLAAETRRITVKGGNGFHVYPARKSIVEVHLLMPFIHWFGKNILRKYLIACYVVMGKEPRWTELKDAGFKDKVNTYYQYSINKTFYRSHSEMKRIFQKQGFHVSFETINNPRIKSYPVFEKFANYPLTKSMLNFLLLNFKVVELLAQKV